MHSSRLITIDELKEYLDGSSIAEKVRALFLQQVNNWGLAKKNYSDLNLVKQKVFQFDGFQIKVQFNPGRILSSSAKVDSISIKERPCFLCVSNLPTEQRGLACNKDYIILVNPFPIFLEHFTIPQIEHKPQRIIDNITSMFSIVKELGSEYSLFYNGPKCGASAPDHMHFQASKKDLMPIETELDFIDNNSEELVNTNSTKVLAVTNYLRKLFLIETNDINSGVAEFQKLYNFIKDATLADDEPLLNIVATYSDKWRIYVFPRKVHRPTQYFLDGDEKILLSPASVDFGGLMITPREEDFLKITKDDLIDIFAQTTISEKTFTALVHKYSGWLVN
jgi:ATP adenylyltransferase/5',5'''-P-1,P-4-tetraphosphate phosphorylase II